MDKLSMSLTQFIRYTLSAGVVVLACALAYPTSASDAWTFLSAEQATVAGFALVVVGMTVYGIHRALLHPFVLRLLLIFIWLFRRRTVRGGFWNPVKPSSLEIALLRAWRTEKPQYADLWAARVHSLYCVAWTIGAIILWGPLYLGKPEYPSLLPTLFVVALLGALLEDLRLNYTVIVVELAEPVATPDTS